MIQSNGGGLFELAKLFLYKLNLKVNTYYVYWIMKMIQSVVDSKQLNRANTY